MKAILVNSRTNRTVRVFTSPYQAVKWLVKELPRDPHRVLVPNKPFRLHGVWTYPDRSDVVWCTYDYEGEWHEPFYPFE